MDREIKMKYTYLKIFPAERGKSRFFSAVLNRFPASFCNYVPGDRKKTSEMAFSAVCERNAPLSGMKEERSLELSLFRKTAEQILSELPPDLFRQLNGGVVVLPGAKSDGDYMVMGEYIEDPGLGSIIVLYYGSFAGELEEASEDQWVEEIEETILHELRHHVESLAGVDYLGEEEERELLSGKSFETDQEE